MGMTTTVIGGCAAASSTAAFVPQIFKIWKTGGKDLSYFMLSLYVAGVTLWLCYGLIIGATALSLANAASIVFAGTCLVLKLMRKTETPRRSEEKRLRIAIDMDETIADSLKEHIRRYNAEFSETITAGDLKGKHLEEFAPFDRRGAVWRMVRDESFFECLDVIREAQQVIHDLARKHEVFIVSAAMEIPESFAAKYRWLQRHFPFISATNVVFCGDKGIIDADYLIDDEARHFSNFPGTGILFSAPHNSRETAYERVSSWHEIRQKFLGLHTSRHSPDVQPDRPANPVHASF
jgi:5'(3')-deoxyribonucleotidase/uncharacterized protein with PQ loop repeat